MKPMFFPTPLHFRKWLTENHKSYTEIWVGYYKKSTEFESISWSESVQEAICFGWIDGLKKSIDELSYCIRFTPRRPTSHWSDLNIKYAHMLIENGKMMPAGLAAFQKRNTKRSSNYSYEQKETKLPKGYEDKIRKNEKAWAYYKTLPKGYKRTSIYYVMSAKRESTQLRRLQILIDASEEGLLIPLIRR